MRGTRRTNGSRPFLDDYWDPDHSHLFKSEISVLLEQQLHNVARMFVLMFPERVSYTKNLLRTTRKPKLRRTLTFRKSALPTKKNYLSAKLRIFLDHYRSREDL